MLLPFSQIARPSNSNAVRRPRLGVTSTELSKSTRATSRHGSNSQTSSATKEIGTPLSRPFSKPCAARRTTSKRV